MPAQILPFIDEREQELQQAQFAQNAQHQQALLQLQQAQFAADQAKQQALLPLQAQALQAEFQKTQQDMKNSYAELQLKQQMQPELINRTRAETAQTQAATAQSQALTRQQSLQSDEYEATAGYRDQKRQNDLAQDALNQQLTGQQIATSKSNQTRTDQGTQLDLADFLLKKNQADLQQKLGNSALDSQAQELAQRKSAALLTIATLGDKRLRKIQLDSLAKSGQIDSQTYNQIMSQPEDESQNFQGRIAEMLGPDAAIKFGELNKIAQRPPTDTESKMAGFQTSGQKAMEFQTSGQKAMDQMSEILHRYMLVKEMRSGFQDAQKLPTQLTDADGNDTRTKGVVYQVPNGQGAFKPMRYVGGGKWADPSDQKYWPSYK